MTKTPQHSPRTYEAFMAEVRTLLDGAAKGKGYNASDLDGHNALYEFVEAMNDGAAGHALGEIVYKARRYAAKRNPEDVLKIAAWAFLIYKHHRAQ